MTRVLRLVPVVAVLVLTATACRPRPEAPPPAPVDTLSQAQRDSIAREQARRDSIAAAERARADSIARADQMRADSARLVAEGLAAARNALTAVVYFDYNSSELTTESQAALEAKLPILNANSAIRMRISGHADERGSDEYNLALGQRRAAAAKRFLTQRGIDGARIMVQSFGEERPAADGHDEAAWAQNRRAEFEITAGGETIIAPPR